MIKTFKSQKPYYDNSKWSQDGPIPGLDCLPRSLQIQEVTNLDINFGMMIINKKLRSGYTKDKAYWGWSVPFGWHVWNENDDTIFDLEDALTIGGYNFNDVEKVRLITPPKFRNPVEFERWLSKTCRSLTLKSNVDVVYIENVAIDRDGSLMTWDDINDLIDEVDQEYNITGQTTNHVRTEIYNITSEWFV